MRVWTQSGFEYGFEYLIPIKEKASWQSPERGCTVLFGYFGQDREVHLNDQNWGQVCSTLEVFEELIENIDCVETYIKIRGIKIKGVAMPKLILYVMP